MKVIPNPVLDGMQLGSQQSIASLNVLGDALNRAATFANTAWENDRKRSQVMNLLAAGLTVDGLVNPNWDANNAKQQELIDNETIRLQSISNLGGPTYYPRLEGRFDKGTKKFIYEPKRR